MKLNSTLLVALVAFVTFSFAGKGIDYKVVNGQSNVTWVGKKVTGEHSGAIKISQGKLVSNGKAITGGTFTMDMTSISNTDITDAKYNQQLVGHLRSDDFFSTEKYPTSTLAITKVTGGKNGQYVINGDLTIKGIKKPISFPATITHAGNQIKAKAAIKVDRTAYDIKYGSGSFFDNLGDKAIDNEFTLNVNLVAQK
ncbi:YceI family protein [Nibribacter ruber]|uniref:YceI family protein n=1 Tax=Nibribacter ruber TaxID=2698458 RepID=A0A6P1NZH5_9BACT|nr:YceI family protein [Nibribacter ruber]QHL87311.1 YceI family protein [Nibribacter ruber]